MRVRLLLQGKLDYRIAGLAAQVLYDELLADGVRIFEYTPAFLHAKVALVDADWATVGSSNIDPLSLLLNLEANLIVRDARVRRASWRASSTPRSPRRARSTRATSARAASGARRSAASSPGARTCTCAWRGSPGGIRRAIEVRLSFRVRPERPGHARREARGRALTH